MNLKSKYSLIWLLSFLVLCLFIPSCTKTESEASSPKSISECKLTALEGIIGESGAEREYPFAQEDFPVVLDFLQYFDRSAASLPVKEPDAMIPVGHFVALDQNGETFTYDYLVDKKSTDEYLCRKGNCMRIDPEDPNQAAFWGKIYAQVEESEEAKKGPFREMPPEIVKVSVELGLGNKYKMDHRHFELPKEKWKKLQNSVLQLLKREQVGKSPDPHQVGRSQGLIFAGTDYRFRFFFPYMELANKELSDQDSVDVLFYSGDDYKVLTKTVPCNDPVLQEIVSVLLEEDPWKAARNREGR